MTVEPQQAPNRRENQAQPPSRQARNEHSTASTDDSPDLLRWRADQLLDEMMLGGVDVSAADLDGRPVTQEPSVDTRPASPEPNRYSDEYYTNEYRHEAPRESQTGEPYPGEYRAGGSYTDETTPAQPLNGRVNGHENSNGHGDYPDSYTNGNHHSTPASHPAQSHPVSPSTPPSNETSAASEGDLPDIDVFFDAYQPAAPRRPENHRPPAVPRPDTQPDTRADTDGGGRNSGAGTYFPGNPLPRSYGNSPDGEDYGTRRTERFGTEDAAGGVENSRVENNRVENSSADEPVMHSKITGSDYLSQRYGLETGEQNGRHDPLAEPSSNPHVREGGQKESPADSSRVYYERQRVDREERMSMAERRPEEPKLGDPAEPPAEDTTWIHRAKEKWNWEDISGVTKKVESEPGGPIDDIFGFELAGYDRDPKAYSQDSPERSDGRTPVSAMSVANGKKRSTLLPRMSSTSADALHQEMAELHAEIGVVLPAGHEASTRAHHLLDKANTILQNDPMRSAEVEYYMQQVRAIVQRMHQTRHWSNLYRERLQVYWGAWLAFSLIILLARYIFQWQFDAVIAGTFGLSYDGFVLQNMAAFTGSLFAGALGGAAGALLTLVRHTQQPYGYVDRKYGLRGLILPVIGLVVGGIIYLPFGLLYTLAGLDPSLNLIAATIPAIGAFAFGFNQESLYGTRE